MDHKKERYIETQLSSISASIENAKEILNTAQIALEELYLTIGDTEEKEV